MSSFNKVILLGNLTRGPEMRTTNSGTSICKFGIATTRVSRGSDGEQREEVVFIDVDAFGKQAEVIGRYFTKGRPIFIEGRLRLDQWESSTGEKRSKLSVILESFQFIGSSRADNTDSAVAHMGSTGGASGPKQLESVDVPAHKVDDEFDEDVPF